MANTMRKVSLRNLAAHKVRLALTVLSVVLGTSFVAGALIFTATIGNGFNAIFDNVAVGVDAQVSPKSQNGQAGTLGVPDSDIAKLQQRKASLGIAKIVPTYLGNAVIADSTGKALQSGGAPSMAGTWFPPERQFDPEIKILPGGRAPHGPGEVVINEGAAKKAGLKVGSHTKVVIASGNAKPLNVTVVGLVKMPGESSGYIEFDFDEATAKKLLTDGSHAANVQLKAAPGVSPEELKSRVAAALPDTKVQTGDELRAEFKAALNQFLQVFNYILLAFAAVGLIVGTFLIYNTFSMIVAQRVKELALLRAVGTGRGQITRSVLLEALIVGLIGGAVGFAIGVGLAAGLKALLSASGSGLPDSPLAITPGSVIACLLVGVGVTMLSAYAPARRASRVSPVEAMRESQTDGSASLRTRTIAGVIAAVAGAALVAIGASGKGGNAALSVGLGALLIILAIVLAGPALAQPAISALGAVFARPFGKLGKLARTNAVRNPRRTAATAFALTLGLILVGVIGTLGSSFKSTIDSTVASDLKANYILMSSGTESNIPTQVGPRVADVPGVERVVQLRNVVAEFDGNDLVGISADGPLTGVYRLKRVSGATTVGPGQILVSEKKAAKHNWRIGSEVPLTSKLGGKSVKLRVVGIYQETAMSGAYFIDESSYRQLVPTQLQRAFADLVVLRPGADSGATQSKIESAIKDYLTVTVRTPKQFANAQSGTIDQMLTVLYGMLGLSLLIAVLGIVNTLALSVIERRREIGMLRAVGMLRSQVRRIIYLESMLIAIFGALLGTVVGVVLGWCLVRTFREWIPGINAVIPWATIGVTLVMSAIVGVLAALWPARQAARTQPLEAIEDA